MTNARSKKMERRTLTQKGVFNLMKRIESSGHLDGEGYWVYDDGVSDQTIANEFGIHFGAVSRRRTESFGKIKVTGNPVLQTIEAMRVEIDALRRRVEHVENRARDHETTGFAIRQMATNGRSP